MPFTVEATAYRRTTTGTHGNPAHVILIGARRIAIMNSTRAVHCPRQQLAHTSSLSHQMREPARRIFKPCL